MLKPYLTVLLACLSLAACSTPKPPAAPKSADEIANAQFIGLAVQAVYPVGREANPGWRQASLAVHYRIDRQNRIVDCKTRPISNPAVAEGLPFAPKIAERMNRLCWQTVLPPMPTKLMGDGPITELVAPLLFPEIDEYPQDQAQETAEYALAAFFWQRLFANQTLDSIGRARLIGILDEQRSVGACEVIIEPHPMRRREFKQDNALLDHLSQACAHLDGVPLLPRQPRNAQGQYVFIVNLDYSPWRHKADTPAIP